MPSPPTKLLPVAHQPGCRRSACKTVMLRCDHACHPTTPESNTCPSPLLRLAMASVITSVAGSHVVAQPQHAMHGFSLRPCAAAHGAAAMQRLLPTQPLHSPSAIRGAPSVRRMAGTGAADSGLPAQRRVRRHGDSRCADGDVPISGRGEPCLTRPPALTQLSRRITTQACIHWGHACSIQFKRAESRLHRHIGSSHAVHCLHCLFHCMCTSCCACGPPTPIGTGPAYPSMAPHPTRHRQGCGTALDGGNPPLCSVLPLGTARHQHAAPSLLNNAVSAVEPAKETAAVSIVSP